MTALAKERMSTVERWTYKNFTLTSGTKAYQNGLCAVALGTGKVVPAAANASYLVIGKFANTVDATSAAKTVNVNFGRELEVEWFENDGTSPVAATDLGALCYIQDDQTVRLSPSATAVAGRVWAVDATKGVAVERLQSVRQGLIKTTLAAFSSNNINVPVSGPFALFDVPTTAANSTITLPATAVEGTVWHFTADGTKNGHTVQYVDASGSTNITTALTASKRHLVVAVFQGSKWFANAYVSP